MEPLYAILGLAQSASDAEVKSVYKKLVIQLHPDKCQGDAHREELFKHVTFAYQTITDPDRREAYLRGSHDRSFSAVVEKEKRRAAEAVWAVVADTVFKEEDPKVTFSKTYLDTESPPELYDVGKQLVARGVGSVKEVCTAALGVWWVVWVYLSAITLASVWFGR